MKIFWSWQSDHEGKVSHFLVRDALQLAIEKLKIPKEIEEPSEADRRAHIELDHDTKNETGWVDIADAIFKKIEDSAVFIADVTPVATSASKLKGGKEVGLRPVMNPNVAIEMGFALKALTWSRCLGVLNLAYGDVDSLPFDISRNRSWPVTYKLEEGASNAEVADARKKLADELYLRLRPFLSLVEGRTERKFEQIPAARPPAFWFEKRQSLGERRDGNSTYYMAHEQALYVRIIPTDPDQKLVPHETTSLMASNYGSFSLDGNLYRLTNVDGAAMCELGDNASDVVSIAQYFTNGEIWGINASIPKLGEARKYRYLLMEHVEDVFRRQLPRFIECITKEGGASLPIRIVAGLTRVKGRALAWSGVPERGYSIMIKDVFEYDRTINSVEPSAINQYLLGFFEHVFEQSGKPRPDKFNGFPE